MAKSTFFNHRGVAAPWRYFHKPSVTEWMNKLTNQSQSCLQNSPFYNGYINYQSPKIKKIKFCGTASLVLKLFFSDLSTYFFTFLLNTKLGSNSSSCRGLWHLAKASLALQEKEEEKKVFSWYFLSILGHCLWYVLISVN